MEQDRARSARQARTQPECRAPPVRLSIAGAVHAVIAAEDAENDNENDENDATQPSEQAAGAGASAAVLTFFYPDEQAFLDAQVSAQRTDPQCPDKAPSPEPVTHALALSNPQLHRRGQVPPSSGNHTR